MGQLHERLPSTIDTLQEVYKTKNPIKLAGRRGFEPRFTESESAGTIEELIRTAKHGKLIGKKI